VKILRAFLAATILLLGTVAHSQVIPFGPNGVTGGPQLDGCASGMCPVPFSPSMGPNGAASLFTPAIDLNFATSTYSGCALASCISVVRASSKTNLLPTSTSGFAFSTFTSNVPAIDSNGLLIEEARTNQLLNSNAPATQTTGTLSATASILWVNGSGSTALSNGTATGCIGTATNGTAVAFTPTAGTCTGTVTGSLNAFQLEAGANGTSFILTAGATATRAADNVTLIGLANTILQSGTFSIIVQTNLDTGSSGILEGSADDLLREAATTQVKSTFGAMTLTATAGSGGFPGVVKSGLSVSPGARSLVMNNGTVVTDTATISVNSVFTLGSFGGSSIFFDGYFARVTIYSTKIPDATLKALTQ
jgi:hypothetical protein